MPSSVKRQPSRQDSSPQGVGSGMGGKVGKAVGTGVGVGVGVAVGVGAGVSVGGGALNVGSASSFCGVQQSSSPMTAPKPHNKQIFFIQPFTRLCPFRPFTPFF